jgi:hypothetical protein
MSKLKKNLIRKTGTQELADGKQIRRGLRRLARRIAKDLFTTGAGHRCERLVLTFPDGTNGGGWSERALADKIERELIAAGGIK